MAERKSSAPLTDADRDSIIMLNEKGLSLDEIANVMHVSRQVVRFAVSVYNLVQEHDYAAAKRKAMQNHNAAVLRWACARAGIDQEKAEKECQPVPRQNEPANRQDSTPATLDDVENAIHVANAKATAAIIPHLEALAKKLDQLSTVIQSCAVDARKNANANADTITAEQKRQTDILNAVKMNTKKANTIWKGGAE